MTGFSLSCCRFFAEHMLCDYRTPAESGAHKLSLLLIGCGPRLDTILQKALVHGQLPDTLLDVTVVTPDDASDAARSLLERAPALGEFADIICREDPSGTPRGSTLCKLRFEQAVLHADSMRPLLERHPDASYLLLSTGNDEQNRALALACAQVSASGKRLIAFVQEKADSAEDPSFTYDPYDHDASCCSHAPRLTSPRQQEAGSACAPVEVYRFGSEDTRDYHRQIEQIALNLHYAYAKAQNPRCPVGRIIEEFHEPYNYLANLEAAVHICAKLACCGIRSSGKEAAIQFRQLLADSPETLDKLAAVEHRRWMMEKLLAGYRPLPDISRIYTGGATTHSKTEKWHCCLVPCDETGHSRLMPSDWENAESGVLREDLDPLDRMTLLIHAQCGRHADTSRGSIRDLFQSVRSTLTEHSCFSAATQQLLEEAASSVTQMQQKKASACALYEKQLSMLKERVSQEGGLLQELLLRQLQTMDSALAPLKEYVSRKDYKLQDRLLVEQIPFALTHRCRPTLAKLISEREQDDIFSLWQMEPSQVTFWGMAGSAAELSKLRDRADKTARFLEDIGIPVRQSWNLMVPEPLASSLSARTDLLANWNCTLVPLAEHTEQAVHGVLEAWMAGSGVDYLELTGAEPLLLCGAMSAARAHGLSVFYVRNGQFCSQMHSEELNFLAPRKNMTVREMMSACGAVLSNVDSSSLADLSLYYKELWEIARNTPLWSELSTALRGAHLHTRRPYFQFMPLDVPQPAAKKELYTSRPTALGLLPALREIETHGFISDIGITNELSGEVCISYTSLGKVDIDNMHHYLQRFAEVYRSSSYFVFNSNWEGRLYLNIFDLTVSDYAYKADPHLSPDARSALPDLLLRLSDAGLIHQYKNSSDLISFRYRSRAVMDCIQKAGSVLESYIYFSALLEADFDDVETGISFLHRADKDSPENEIDVICTKGLSSLFISAKFTRTLTEKFNYVLYEISLLAEHFGINAKPVLVASCFSQFETDPNTGAKIHSREVRHALRRGVYVVGQECLRENVLGRVLQNIADGREDWCDFVKDPD